MVSKQRRGKNVVGNGKRSLKFILTWKINKHNLESLFSSTSSMANLTKLEEHLASRSYVEG
jgi:hypothetical protein